MLQSMGSQRVRHDLETEEQQQGGSQNLHMGEVEGLSPAPKLREWEWRRTLTDALWKTTVWNELYVKSHEPCGPCKDLYFCSAWDETGEDKGHQDQHRLWDPGILDPVRTLSMTLSSSFYFVGHFLAPLGYVYPP